MEQTGKLKQAFQSHSVTARKGGPGGPSQPEPEGAYKRSNSITQTQGFTSQLVPPYCSAHCLR